MTASNKKKINTKYFFKQTTYIQGNTLQNTYKSQPSLLEATKKHYIHEDYKYSNFNIHKHIYISYKNTI